MTESVPARAVKAHDEQRLERSVAATLRVIAAAHAEREAPPVHAARRRLGEVYGATRLARRLERAQRA
ncbi:hypothetical protein MKK70_06000 [Methylobacterium sp. E-041]|jgi:hypothetical protein|uniref:hypothetical protein n=1 Tax=unclassified Methylobacterium TaxID=2615210 RepID=UPI0011CAA1CC|nr:MULTISPECIES: hypothetical protein [unclassified Methylobacterium]MCJ2010882.1 hypothetical protein [Methylobacterium sp. J-092]MCJ2042659.1 hypothetical protein [Methylobacterium sp. J-059]MCJ2078163.1 hypothetical protein [Methylobacterium sp. E-016]MCJ2104940.1 hypothetical protein [Methylobacterium sp. E-041]MCJ2114835.1 hypothetical protein [Methylobacterium sp. E-025]